MALPVVILGMTIFYQAEEAELKDIKDSRPEPLERDKMPTHPVAGRPGCYQWGNSGKIYCGAGAKAAQTVKDEPSTQPVGLKKPPNRC